MRDRNVLALLVLSSSIALTACGSGGKGAASTAGSSSASTSSTAPPPPSAPPPPPTASTVTAPPGGETQRVPASFRLIRGRLAPMTIGVPAGLRIQLTVRNVDPAPHRVTFRGRTVALPPQGERSLLLGGLRKGRYPVRVAGGGEAVIITGVEPGP